MAREVLEQGGEPSRAPSVLGRAGSALRRTVDALPLGTRAVLVALSAVLVAGLVAVPLTAPSGPFPLTAPTGPPSDPPPAAAPGGEGLQRAEVTAVTEVLDGVLRVRARLEGGADARLPGLRVEVPGSAVVLDPFPTELPAGGRTEVSFGLLPHCPDAVAGLRRAALVTAPLDPDGGRSPVRVPLSAGPVLPEVVRSRCAPGAAPHPLDGLLVRPAAGAPRGAQRSVLRVLAPGGTSVTVTGVDAREGLRADVRTRLPLVLRPGAPAVRLVVDLRAEGCGGALDAPPYLLHLRAGQTVFPTVGADLQRRLAALRPSRCSRADGTADTPTAGRSRGSDRPSAQRGPAPRRGSGSTSSRLRPG